MRVTRKFTPAMITGLKAIAWAEERFACSPSNDGKPHRPFVLWRALPKGTRWGLVNRGAVKLDRRIFTDATSRSEATVTEFGWGVLAGWEAAE